MKTYSQSQPDSQVNQSDSMRKKAAPMSIPAITMEYAPVLVCSPSVSLTNQATTRSQMIGLDQEKTMEDRTK